MGVIKETLGGIASKLLVASTLYAFIALAISISFYSSGKTPPPLAPDFVLESYISLAKAWDKVSGAIISGNQVQLVVSIFNLITNGFRALVAFVVNVTTGLMYVSYQVSLLIPNVLYPFKILAFVVGVASNTVIVVYLLESVMEKLSSFVPGYGG